MFDKFFERLSYEGYTYEEMCIAAGGGGKSKPPPPPPIIEPTPPVEEASVEIDDTDSKKKLKTGKSSLKLPLAKATGTGLKV